LATSRRSRLRRRARSRLASLFALVALFAVGSAFAPDVAFAAHYAKGQVWSPPQTPLEQAKGVPGSYAPKGKSHPLTSPVPHHQAPAVDLPRAGQTTTAIGTGPVARLAAGPVVAGTAARVGSSPLWVAAATSGAAAPSGVNVRFADPTAARKGGITSGLLFGVARGDASTTAGRVAVQLDPSLLTGEGGADLGSRLRLVELPACALTTPQLAACQRQTPVSAVRDPKTGRIVADLTLSATQAPTTGSAKTPAATTSKTASTFAAPVAGTGAAQSPTSGAPTTALASGGQMTVLAAVTGQSGSTGSFAATSLKPSDQWSGGGATGDFNYSYPITMPATIGGGAPTVTLNYSSSSVDGENASTNSQTSWVGDGWDTASNFIERSYQACSQDGLPTSSDTCWAYGGHEASVSGSNGGPLVYDDASSKWHLSSDSGATVNQLTGLNNGAYNGEGWVVTLQDGTRMYYGAGKLPTAEGGTGSDVATNSVSTEPVYCPKSGDPCYSSTTGTSSYTASMGYRWYLDFVIDPHGNTTKYTYTQETNYYARSSAHTPTLYDRGAHLVTIQYGWRAADVASQGASPASAAKVVFTNAGRCVPGTVISGHTVTASDCSTLVTATAPYWPDVPYDQGCGSSGTCTNYSMSYFSTVRLTTITTDVNTGTTTTPTYTPVDTYALTESYPDPGDGTSPALRLDSVTRTGNDGTAISLPAVGFVYAAMPNRVPGAASWPAFNRYRITAINTETGETINVAYSSPDCNQSTTAPDLPTPSNDTRLCYQEYWTPPSSTLTPDWFEKYVVKEVQQIDEVGGAPTRYTDYTYNGTPAWHRNDSVQTANAQRTWDQFRGYGDVLTETGHGTDPLTDTHTLYLRGMDGDSQSQTGGSPRSVTVTDLLGDTITDSNQYAGFAYETKTYTQYAGTLARYTVTLPWSQQTASHAETTPTGVPAETAHFTGDATTVTSGLEADGTTWRTAKTVNVYSPTTGLLTQADSQGDTSLLGSAHSQETCTTYTYATPPTSGVNTGLVNAPAESTTVAVTTGTGVGTAACPAKTPANTTEDTRSFYDGSTTAGVIPAAGVGNVTELDALGGWTGTTENWTKKATSPSSGGYDVYGRQLSTTDIRGATTTTAYTPATGALPTSTVTTAVTAGNWQTTTTLDQLRQLPTKVVDPNGNSISKAYDALGRLTSVWLPNRATTASASQVFVYTVGGQSAPTWIETKALRDDATYHLDYQIYNGFMDLRQDQNLSLDSANSNGTLVSDHFYDSHGQQVKTTSTPYYITNAPSSTIYQATDANVPGQNVTTYDGMGRPTQSAFYSYANLQWASTTAYPGVDRTDMSVPSGGTATSTVTDGLGRTTALWKYQSNTATGKASDATVTSYDYSQTTTASGGEAVLATITDSAGHVRTSTTDALGNKVASTDPDAGASSFTYDAAGDLLTSTDANGTTLTNSYDVLGRKKTLYQGSTELDSWSYDTAPGGNGQLASQTSYSSGNQFTQTVAGYTNLGSSTGLTTTIPSSEGGLAGAYSVTYGYTPVTGLLDHTTYNADGGLPAETVYNAYTEGGQLGGVGGNADYLTQIVSNPLGQITRYTLGDMPDQVVLTNTYDTATTRATTTVLDKENGTGHVDNIGTWWNQAGKITAQQDIQDNSTATDRQCYTYNGQDQLTTAWTDKNGITSAASPSVPNIGACKSSAPSASTNGGPAPYWETYSYDADGNRTGLTTHDTTGTVTGTQTSTYPVATGTTGQPDTAQTTTTQDSTGTTTATSTYAYNPDGSTKNRTTVNGGGTTTSNQNFTYTPDGRTNTVTDTTTGNSAGYTYDAAGSLLEQKNTISGNTTTLLYLPGEQLTKNSSGGITALRYYSVGGGLTVIRDNTGKLTYQAANAQGTGVVDIDSTLTTQTRHPYTPYGTTRGVTSPTLDGRGYLNQPADPATNYDLLGARNYDPTTGRFLQADPILEATSPNQLGGYTYAADDPVNGSDPTGLKDPDCANSGFSCGGGTVTDPEGEIVDGDGNVIGHTSPPHTCGVGSCDTSAWGDSAGFAERHHIWDAATNKRWDAFWAPARAALAAKATEEAKFRSQQAALAAEANKPWWERGLDDAWNATAKAVADAQKGLRLAANIMSDASTVTGLLGGMIAMCLLPLCTEAAGILSAASLALGVGATAAYALGGDEANAESALAGTVLSIATGGLGKLGGARLAGKLADGALAGKSWLEGGISGMIDAAGPAGAAGAKAAARHPGGIVYAAKAALGITTGIVPGVAPTIANGVANPLNDQGMSNP
jgi:RHS repeat-associated protein